MRCDRVGCRSAGLRVLVGLWAVLAAAGCSSTPEECLERGPLPYHVCVYIDREALGFIAGDSPSSAALDGARGGSDGNGGAEASAPAPAPEPQRIQYRLSAEELATHVAHALSTESGTVSLARVVESPTREDAIKIARGANADLLLAVGFETRAEYSDSTPTFGWGALEVVSWLFGGFGAWFVPSVEYQTLSRLKVELVDLGTRSPGDSRAPASNWSQEINAPYQNVSLWDRSYPFDRPLDYLSTIIVPPMVLNPGDRERLSQELTGDVNGELEEKLGASLREELLRAEREGPVSIVFMSPDPSEVVEGENLKLTLGIANRGPAKLAALDVHRFASGVEKHRWVMQRADLDRLGEALAAPGEPGGYTLLALPEELPLAPGENVVKARLLRDDGSLLTRTMVYRR